MGFVTRAVICSFSIAASAVGQTGYTNTPLVANDPVYEPLILVDPLLSNGWGVALRPPGAGGHFWISNANTGTTTTYVGDVHVADGRFTPLFQDSLRVVQIGRASGIRFDGTPTAPIPQPTGQVFNSSTTDFVVSGEGVTGASKFLFVTAEGTISGWTEVRDGQGVLHRQTTSVVMVDQSDDFDDERIRFTGCAVTDFASNNRLYVTNWTMQRVEVYDHLFQRVEVPVGRFDFPDNTLGYRPWNAQYLHTGPNGEGRIWVTYNIPDDPWEEFAEFGAVAEFDLEGNFIRRLAISTDVDPFADSELRDPWGLAIAPANFGPHAGELLVANFGDGSIAAYNLQTGQFDDFLRDDNGQVLIVDGIWGFTFGNGVALGDTDALYYAAGPNGEADGIFGTIRYTPSTCPVIQRQPVSAAVCGSSAVTLVIDAPSPVRVAYQWEREESSGVWAAVSDGPTASGSFVSGSTSAALTVAGVTRSDAGAYRCVVSNTCGSATSDAAVLLDCRGYFNCNGFVDSADFFQFVAAYFENTPNADFNMDSVVNSQDFFDFLAVFFTPCRS